MALFDGAGDDEVGDFRLRVTENLLENESVVLSECWARPRLRRRCREPHSRILVGETLEGRVLDRNEILVIATLWWWDPKGDYEPQLAFIAAVVAIVEIIKNRRKN